MRIFENIHINDLLRPFKQTETIRAQVPQVYLLPCFEVTLGELIQRLNRWMIHQDEDYDEFIQRSLKNEIGSKVKIADLRENLDVTRICELTEKDIERINKYKRALKTITEC